LLSFCSSCCLDDELEHTTCIESHKEQLFTASNSPLLFIHISHREFNKNNAVAKSDTENPKGFALPTVVICHHNKIKKHKITK